MRASNEYSEIGGPQNQLTGSHEQLREPSNQLGGLQIQPGGPPSQLGWPQEPAGRVSEPAVGPFEPPGGWRKTKKMEKILLSIGHLPLRGAAQKEEDECVRNSPDF